MPNVESGSIVQAILVSYNSAHVIGESIAPLYDNPNINIVVVDNSSTDNTLDYLRDAFPRVTVIRSGGNLGFAKAVNIGAARSTDDFLLLLNPDAVIRGADVVRLANKMRQSPTIGIGAPHIRQPIGTFRILEVGRQPDLKRIFFHYSGLSRFAKRWPAFEGQFLLKGHAPRSRQVDWVSGAVMMIRRELFEDLGGLTERWFMYAEDIDFCYRSKQAGREVWYFDDIPALHAMGASSNGEPTSTNPAPYVNLFDFYRSELAKSKAHVEAWRFVVAAGLASRGIAYRMKALSAVSVSQKSYWHDRSRTFRDYARAVRSHRFDSDVL